MDAFADLGHRGKAFRDLSMGGGRLLKRVVGSEILDAGQHVIEGGRLDQQMRPR